MKRASKKRSLEKEDPLLQQIYKNQAIAFARTTEKANRKQTKLDAFLKNLPPPPDNVDEMADEVIARTEHILGSQEVEHPRAESMCFSRDFTFKCCALYAWEDTCKALDVKDKYSDAIDEIVREQLDNVKQIISEKWEKKHPKIPSHWTWRSFCASL